MKKKSGFILSDADRQLIFRSWKSVASGTVDRASRYNRRMVRFRVLWGSALLAAVMAFLGVKTKIDVGN